jgi:hypothetical protein
MRFPLHSRLLAGFALAQVPLILIGAALEWYRYAPKGNGAVADIALQGGTVSGPITAQIWFLPVAYLAARGGRTGTVFTAVTAIAGLLILGNGVASLFADAPAQTPGAALVIGSIAFSLAGAAIAGAAIGSLIRRLAPAPAV